MTPDQTESLPQGWTETALKDVSVMRLGKMLDAAKQSSGRQCPYLRNINVRWFDFQIDALQTMAFESREETEFELQPGDLLVCEGGEPGRCAIWTQTKSPIKFQKAIHRLRLPSSIEPKWVMYDLRRASLDGSYESGLIRARDAYTDFWCSRELSSARSTHEPYHWKNTSPDRPLSTSRV